MISAYLFQVCWSVQYLPHNISLACLHLISSRSSSQIPITIFQINLKLATPEINYAVFFINITKITRTWVWYAIPFHFTNSNIAIPLLIIHPNLIKSLDYTLVPNWTLQKGINSRILHSVHGFNDSSMLLEVSRVTRSRHLPIEVMKYILNQFLSALSN